MAEALNVQEQGEETVVIRIECGEIRGYRDGTPSGFSFYSFLGIPYGKPPYGTLRFKAPVPAEPWKDILDCTEDGDACYHFDIVTDIQDGGEDCLNLSVYTPELPQNGKTIVPKAVMVWIHGGGFICGSNRRLVYGPDYFIDKDIIFVAMNYRLGSLGFLSLKDPSLGVPGNAGLKDQVLALKWIQKNIAYFGGDPNNVTIFGESAGAASVGCHLISPMSAGLFHKVILQSGVPNCLWASASGQAAHYLMGSLDKWEAPELEALNTLQSLPVETLVGLQKTVSERWKPSRKRLFAPIVEKPSPFEEAFLPEDAMKLLREKGCNPNVPVMIGVTSQEGLLMPIMENKWKKNFTPKNDEKFIPFSLNAMPGSKLSLAIGEKIRKFYYKNEFPTPHNRHFLIEYMSDVYFNRPCIEFISTIFRKCQQQKIFAFRFNLETELNIIKKQNGLTQRGACHSEDLFYFFCSALVNPDEIVPNSDEDLAMKRLSLWWTNFAKHGDPNGIDPNPLLGVHWAPAQFNNIRYLDISTDSKMFDHFYGKVHEFWSGIETAL